MTSHRPWLNVGMQGLRVTREQRSADSIVASTCKKGKKDTDRAKSGPVSFKLEAGCRRFTMAAFARQQAVSCTHTPGQQRREGRSACATPPA